MAGAGRRLFLYVSVSLDNKSGFFSSPWSLSLSSPLFLVCRYIPGRRSGSFIKGNWSMNNCIHFWQGFAFTVTVPNLGILTW